MTHTRRTVVFWGAGATASLGMRVTGDQPRFLGRLASVQEDTQKKSLRQRVCDALDSSAVEPRISALSDLLIILGDEAKEGVSIASVTAEQKDAMRRNWCSSACEDEIQARIIELRTLYDWPALKAIINVCPGIQEGGDSFQLNDLFNILDMHGQSGHGFRVKGNEFLTPQQVLGARNALKMLLQTMFYIDWHYGREAKREHLEHHYDFAIALGRRMQRQGLELAGRNTSFDNRKFYLGDVSFACFNWDPIALWCQFVANRNLNSSPSVPHVGCPACKLQIFHDLGHFVAGPRVEDDKGRSTKTPWHPMNESSALRLNDPDHGSSDRIRISKFLLPHGCLWWRECPDCGKLSSYMGDIWEWDSPTLIPPPPLKAFVRDVEFRPRDEKQDDEKQEDEKSELRAWEKGKVDARACVHCRTLTYAHHTQMIMQSNFKSPPPPFLDEIKRDLRVAVQKADHIVLMGYSLPPDDVDYRAFFAARRRLDPDKPPVKCSVVSCLNEHSAQYWCGPSEWLAMLPDMKKAEAPRTTLEAARDLFGKDNVRFYGGGIPNVFLDGGRVTDSAVDDLLIWKN